MKCYSNLNCLPAITIRHGIYEHPLVQKEVGSIIRSVSIGRPGRLATAEEIEQEEAVQRGVICNWKVLHEQFLCWGEPGTWENKASLLIDKAGNFASLRDILDSTEPESGTEGCPDPSAGAAV